MAKAQPSAVSDKRAKLSDMAGARISVRIDAETQRWLKEEAAASGKKPSEIVRETIEARRDKRPRKRTLYDAFLEAGLIGAIKGGPPDLSTNKKYFEGFGENRHARADRYERSGRGSKGR